MKARDIGERALINRISQLLPHDIVLGAGEDDCAVLDYGDEYLLITTDMLHKSTDFPDGMAPWQVGWMAVAVTLSDIAAMGGRPLAILTALGLPNNMEIVLVEDIIKGMNACAEEFSTSIVGGDTDEHDELTIVCTALGSVEKGKLLRRRGARKGDLVCVTGELGTTEAGLRALKMDVAQDVRHTLTKKLFEPQPRVREALALAESGAVTSMMDISDGLALSLHDLSKANSVGFLIYGDKLPVLDETKVISTDLDLPLYGAGDFELLFTIKPDYLENAGKACQFAVIGEVTSGDILIKKNGVTEKIEARGYEHFR
ncbi:MAG: thiamine-phosphate kinase [Methanosarcinales archaeon]|nr:MAG: thiamine-phosphate kinase [Methanosarcinales archaeon]